AIPEGQSVPVGTVIMVLAEPGESVEAAAGAPPTAAPQARAPESSRATAAAKPAPASPPSTAPPAPTGDADDGLTGSETDRVFASPLARKIAEENNVDLGAIQGSGPSGRIVRRDVEAAMGGTGARPSAAPVRARQTAEPSKRSTL